MIESPYTAVPVEKRSQRCQSECYFVGPQDRVEWRPCGSICQLLRDERIHEHT